MKKRAQHNYDVIYKKSFETARPRRFGVVSVDCQEMFRKYGNWPESHIAAAEDFLERARDYDMPVIHLKYGASDFIKGLEPKNGEAVIQKQHNSGFKGTELDDVLQKMGITDVLEIGGHASYCGMDTFKDGRERGYNIRVVPEAMMDVDGKSFKRAMKHYRRECGVASNNYLKKHFLNN